MAELITFSLIATAIIIVFGMITYFVPIGLWITAIFSGVRVSR